MGISNLFLDAILLTWSVRHLSKLSLKNSHYGDSSPGLGNLSWSIYSGCRGWTIPFLTAAVSPLGYVDVPSVFASSSGTIPSLSGPLFSTS